MHRYSLIGLLGGFFAVAVAAQSGSVVTEAEFLSVLDETHPAVRESAGPVGLAEARLLAARTLDNPVLEAVREDPAGPIGQTDVLVSWQIPGAARRPEIEAREGEIGAARRRLTHNLLGYRLAMREAYAGWAVAAARRQRLSTQAERVESLAGREAVRADRGEASGLEARRLRLAAATLRSRVALAAGGERRGEGRGGGLASWLAGGDARPVLPELPDAPSLDGADTRVAGGAGRSGRCRTGRRCHPPDRRRAGSHAGLAPPGLDAGRGRRTDLRRRLVRSPVRPPAGGAAKLGCGPRGCQGNARTRGARIDRGADRRASQLRPACGRPRRSPAGTRRHPNGCWTGPRRPSGRERPA